MKTIILLCDCKHTFQDEKYGKGMRVHNISFDKKKAYCTVCCPSAPHGDKSAPARKSKSI